MAEAFHIAASGRPGAVLVDIPKDVLQAQCTFSWPPRMDLPGYKPNTKPHNRQIHEAAKLIAAARKPVLYVGGGVIRGEATEQLRELAELTGIPVVTTLMARGAFPDSHRQHLGMPGMHGTVAAVGALQKADLIVLVISGSRAPQADGDVLLVLQPLVMLLQTACECLLAGLSEVKPSLAPVQEVVPLHHEEAIVLNTIILR